MSFEMLCKGCSATNRRSAKFCVECGVAFNCTCVKCGALNLPTFKFCAECGVALRSSLSAAPGTPPKAVAERRHLTVLFSDLVSSTRIAAQLDLEEWHQIAAEYQALATNAIARFGGHVAKYLGDGVMAFFGYPEAHDNNDAERAVRAGLAILKNTADLNKRRCPRLSVRVGVHSGGVVVTGSGKDADAFGDAPNIAARVQESAAPDTVMVNANTHQLVSGLFTVDDRGPQHLKGIDQPIRLYRIIRPSGVRGRLEATAAARGLSLFIGREEEL